MTERDAFGPNLQRIRMQRGVTLEEIARSTKVSAGLWADLERGSLSRWPTGIYARSYVRAYAVHIGVDPEATVDEFCRWFPQGDHRAEPIVRKQAAIVSHDHQWSDDLVADLPGDRRSGVEASEPRLLASKQSARIIAALADIVGQTLAGAVLEALTPMGWSGSLACGAIGYHAIAVVALGRTPAVWAIEAFVQRASFTPHAGTGRSLRLLRGSSASD